MNKKKKDYLIFTLCFQFVICTVLFVGLYALKNTESSFYKTVKSEFFNNIDEDIFTLSEYKPDGLKVTENAEETVMADTTQKIVVVNNDVGEKYQNTSANQLLYAQVGARGGTDYGVESETDVPDNVSVNNYTLNKKMIRPLNGEITSEFGLRLHPISGEKRFHAGIDIAADTGTPIYACFDGEVIVADYDEWNGYYLKIVHDGDIMTVFCHCNELFVEKGDLVKAGDIIAEVGSTGSSTGPHLHFEFRINNISYDPQIALSEATDAV